MVPSLLASTPEDSIFQAFAVSKSVLVTGVLSLPLLQEMVVRKMTKLIKSKEFQLLLVIRGI
jgi:hypothetical protein